MKAKTVLLLAAAVGMQALAADPSATTKPSMRETGASGMMSPMMDATAITSTFTVQDIDPETRMITLKAPDGAIDKFKAGPEIRNFDQIHKGDLVRATVMDEIGVAITQPGMAPPPMGEANMVAVAPKGAKPGIVMVQSESVTAKVAAIDADKRMVSLEEPSGKTRTIKVSSKVDLTQLKKGDDITVQVAQGFAINVETPQAEPSGGTMSPDKDK
jgi:hypothetical protein